MRILAFSSLLALAACSHVDVGEIDYRRAEPPTPPVARRAATYVSDHCPPQSRTEIEVAGAFVAAKEKACLPLLEGRLFRKNLGIPNTKISKKDVYSIRLEHGLISFMTEPGFSPTRWFYGRRHDLQIGEIVVLANVFEFGEGGTASRFNDLTDLSQVKVIYYSPDVEARQDLNFSNIPLKAPAEYGGNPIGIQIIVLELDRMSSQLQSLLKTLAGLGQQSNLAPSGIAGKLLLDLGTSMLTQNNDDTIFEYRFVLDPSDGSLSAQSAPFESGRYVIKRTNERSRDQIWRNFVVDHNTGRLMLLSSDSKDAAVVRPTPFTEDTYFTLNVIKHPKGTTPSAFGFKTLDELGREIETAASTRDAPFAEVKKAVDGKILDLRRSSQMADLLPAWEEASSKFRDYGRAMAPVEMDTKTCSVVEDHAARLSSLQYEATAAVVRFHRLYLTAKNESHEEIADGASKSVPLFSAEHKLQLLAAMAPYFFPETEGAVKISELTNPDAFDAAYAAEGPSALVGAMDVMAKSQWRAKSCNDLIAANLATAVKPEPAQSSQSGQ